MNDQLSLYVSKSCIATHDQWDWNWKKNFIQLWKRRHKEEIENASELGWGGGYVIDREKNLSAGRKKFLLFSSINVPLYSNSVFISMEYFCRMIERATGRGGYREIKGRRPIEMSSFSMWMWFSCRKWCTCGGRSLSSHPSNHLPAVFRSNV